VAAFNDDTHTVLCTEYCQVRNAWYRSSTAATITATTPPLQVRATATASHGVIIVIIIRIMTIKGKHNKA